MVSGGIVLYTKQRVQKGWLQIHTHTQQPFYIATHTYYNIQGKRVTSVVLEGRGGGGGGGDIDNGLILERDWRLIIQWFPEQHNNPGRL